MPKSENIIFYEDREHSINYINSIASKKYNIHIFDKLDPAIDAIVKKLGNIVLIDYAVAKRNEFKDFRTLLNSREDVRFVVVAGKASRAKTKNAVNSNQLYFIDSPVQQNKLFYLLKKILKSLMEKYKHLDDSKAPAEERQDKLSFVNLNCSLSKYLFLSSNMQAIQAKGKRTAKNILEITTNHELKPDTELLLIIKDEGIPLKVAAVKDSKAKEKFLVTLIMKKKDVDLLELLKDEILIINYEGKFEQKDQTELEKEEHTLQMPESVAIIDDEEDIAKILKHYLIEAGCTKVDYFTQGETAWKEMQKFQYDFVIQDWSLPDIKGLALTNRFRQSELYAFVPVLIISGFIEKQDLSILGDFQILDFVEKPIQSTVCIKKVAALFNESMWFKTQEHELFDFFENISQNKEVNEENIINFIESSPNKANIAMITGKLLKEQKNYDLAEKSFKIAMKSKKTILKALNEIAKIYLEMGRNKEAKPLLEQALKISPNNLERLCNLGDLSLKAMDFKGANKYFNKALAIDGKNHKAKSGKKLSKNLSDYLVSADSVPESYAGLLNSVGISMTRQGKIKEGIEHYKNALQYIEDDTSKARLSFNLGFAYYRSNELPQASSWMEHALQLSPSFEKAQKYSGVVQKKMQDTGIDASKAPSIENISPDDFIDQNDEFESFDLALEESSKEPEVENYENEMRELQENCPKIKSYFHQLASQEENINSHIFYLHKLMKKNNINTFNKAIDISLEKGDTSVFSISQTITKLTEKPKAS